MRKVAHAARRDDCSIIALDKFIQATRDSGYKGTASAISELVDNSIQAGAKCIAISVTAKTKDGDEKAIEISVLDNGCGMDSATLRQALRFGGSTRFGDRTGLGRYGMGLPNASLSQAQRVTVYTWQADARAKSGVKRGREPRPRVHSSYLDVGEIVRGKMVEVPEPQIVSAPPSACAGRSGTLVVWSRCDRLDNRRVSTIVRRLEAELGRRFRHFIWEGLRITINGDNLEAFDPLYLNPKAEISGAQLFGEVMRFEVRADPIDSRRTGWVRVRFTELPVHAWYKLSNDEKRRIGLSKGAGVSIVRGGREVDSLVRHVEVDGVPLIDDAVDWRRGAGVLITTARAFKGLEADVVIAYGLGSFGALFTPTDLYVAWTRACHRLLLICQPGEVRAAAESALAEAARAEANECSSPLAAT